MTSVTTFQQFDKLNTEELCRWLKEKIPSIDTSKVLSNQEMGCGFAGSLSYEFDYVADFLKEFGWSRGHTRVIWSAYSNLLDDSIKPPEDNTISRETKINQQRELTRIIISIGTNVENMKSIIESITNQLPLINVVTKYLKEMENNKIDIQIDVFRDGIKDCFFVCSPKSAIIHLFKDGLDQYVISVTSEHQKVCKWTVGKCGMIMTFSPHPMLKNSYSFSNYFDKKGITGFCNSDNDKISSSLMDEKLLHEQCAPAEIINTNKSIIDTDLIRYSINYPQYLDYLKYRAISVDSTSARNDAFIQKFDELMRDGIELKVKMIDSPKLLLVASEDLDVTFNCNSLNSYLCLVQKESKTCPIIIYKEKLVIIFTTKCHPNTVIFHSWQDVGYFNASFNLLA